MSEPADPLVEMARSAERALASASLDDLDGLESALGRALEAARQLRVQIDLGRRVDVTRLLAFEALFRSAVEVQPKLGDAEIDGMVTAIEAGSAPSALTDRAGNVRAHAFVVARAVLDSLRAGYRVGFEMEARS